MNKVLDQVRCPVHGRDSALDRVDDQVRNQVWDQVQHQIQQGMIQIQYQIFDQLTMVTPGNARNSFSNL